MRILLLIALCAFFAEAQARTSLTADIQYAVPGDFSTPQEAWNHVQKELDLSCHKVKIQVANGSYGPMDIAGKLTGACSTDAVTFTGNVSSPSSVAISGVGVNAITVHAGAWVKLEGFIVVAVQAQSFMTGGHGLIVYEQSKVQLGMMAWYVCEFAHITVSEDSSLHAESTTQYIMQSSQIFALVEAGGKLWLNGATIINTVPVTFSNAFVLVSQLGLADFSGTIMNATGGPIFGRKCDVTSNSVLILLNMAWPGSGTCTIGSGGQLL